MPPLQLRLSANFGIHCTRYGADRRLDQRKFADVTSGISFILGGAASGKSAFAEDFVEKSGLNPVYLATAQAFDAEMHKKIADHQARRGDHWTTLETPFDPAKELLARSGGEIVLLDCLTLWLTNLLLDDRDIDAAVDGLCAALNRAPCPVVIVSNEVGQGIVPENALSRQFRGVQGAANQRVAALADRAALVVAGLPVVLKGSFDR